MTDAFEAQGELAPVQSIHNNEFSAVTSEVPVLEALDAASTEANEVLEVADQDAQTSDAPEAPRGPNGFIPLGLAPELIAAVEDLGFHQPTTVQEKVIPLARGDESARFVDLMVSSQTGSGKTAAFLLPVLHTLIRRQAEAAAAERAEFDRLAAEAAEKKKRGGGTEPRPHRQADARASEEGGRGSRQGSASSRH